MNTEQAQSRLDDIDTDGRGLTEWEIDFVDDMLRQTDSGRPPSEKQMAIIDRIWRERVER